MNGRTRAKLTVLLFLGCIFSLLWLPNSAGKVARPAASTAENNPHTTPESLSPVSFHGSVGGS